MEMSPLADVEDNGFFIGYLPALCQPAYKVGYFLAHLQKDYQNDAG